MQTFKECCGKDETGSGVGAYGGLAMLEIAIRS